MSSRRKQGSFLYNLDEGIIAHFREMVKTKNRLTNVGAVLVLSSRTRRKYCHPRESGNPGVCLLYCIWIPAFAGMTVKKDLDDS